MENRNKEIENYLFGRLSDSEKTKFEEAMKFDKELNRDVTLFSEAIESLETLGREELKEELSLIHKEVVNDEIKKTDNSKRNWTLILLAILLAIAIIYSIISYSSSTPEKAYYAFYEPYEVSLAQRSTEDSKLITIQNLYDSRSFNEVIQTMNENSDLSQSNNPELILSLAISYLETNQFDKAHNQFNRIEGTGNINYKDDVLWYKSLTFLKSGSISECTIILENIIAQKDSYYLNDAKDLLSELKK